MRGLLPWQCGENVSMATLCVPNKLGCEGARAGPSGSLLTQSRRFWRIGSNKEKNCFCEYTV